MKLIIIAEGRGVRLEYRGEPTEQQAIGIIEQAIELARESQLNEMKRLEEAKIEDYQI